MAEISTEFDPAEYLTSPETIAEFIADAFETRVAAYIAKAMGIAVRAKGMSEIAREAGLSREQLYRSFSEHGNPTLKSMLTVMKALGVDVTVRHHIL